jgi:hypothetical protein
MPAGRRSYKTVLVAGILFFAAMLSQGHERPASRPYGWIASSSVGVNAHLPSPQDFDAMSKAGLGWARIDLTWDVMEPERGQYEWQCLDSIVEEAESHKIRLLGILGYAPLWASSGPTIHDPPRDVQQWKDFVRAIVGRYKGRITHWSLWNEPNSRTFFKGSMTQFIHGVLIPGAKAAKEANPECRIVGPDLAHLHGAEWDRWMERILAEGGCYLDVISHHCYQKDPKEVFRELEGPKFFWEPDAVRAILERHHQDIKPFWLTEVGWKSTEIGPERQAGCLISLLRGVEKRPWITKVFIFEMKDYKCAPGYGLLDLGENPKPAFTALRGFIIQNGFEAER